MAGLIIVAMVSFIVLGTADQFLNSGGRGGGQDDRVVATWTGGKFTQQDINQLRLDRALLNGFIRSVKVVEARNRGEDRLGQYPEYDTKREEDIIRTALLVEEAKKLGIELTDDQVYQAIKRLSGDSVSDAQLNGVLREMSNRDQPVSYAQVIEAFRRELLANQVKLVYNSPGRYFDHQATPAQRWEYFCRLNRRVKLQLHAIPVERYISDARIKDPTDSQLRAFYEQYKNVAQSPTSPEPGFKLPEGVKLEYIKADYLKFYEAAKSKLSEDEIRAEFDKDKDTMRENLEFAERMSEFHNPPASEEDDETDRGGKPVVKAPEPDPTPYEVAVGRFAKHAPRATEPRFTDEEVLHRFRETIVKRLAEQRARKDMQDALTSIKQAMDRFYGKEYRQWVMANSANDAGDSDGEPDAAKTPPPKFDLAQFANPEVGLTYHQTPVMSRAELQRDKYLGQTFINRRWGSAKDPQTDVERTTIVDRGTWLPDYAFQTKALMVPFSGEDQIEGSAEGFYRNQYVLWRTAHRDEEVPAFADIEDRVKRAWRIANDSGKSARDLARQDAERLAQTINGDKTTLKEHFADSPDVKETGEFTWYEDQVMPGPGGALPAVRAYPTRTRLDEVEYGEDRFFRDVFRLADKQAGVAMNDAGSIVYVVQIFDSADTSPETLRKQFLSTPYSRYIPQLAFFYDPEQIPFDQGIAAASRYAMGQLGEAWYEQLEREYDVEWGAAASE